MYHKNASKYKYKRIKHKSFNGIHDCKILNRIAKDKGDRIFETVKINIKRIQIKRKNIYNEKPMFYADLYKLFYEKQVYFGS